LTPPSSYGDNLTLAFESRTGRGEDWISIVFADGPYVTVIGAYDAAGAETAMATAQALAAIVDARLRAASLLAPDATPTASPAPKPSPELDIVALATMTRQGRPRDTFRPHSDVYWRVIWRVAAAAGGARETVHEWVAADSAIVYQSALTDRAYAGANTLTDHLLMQGSAPGRYAVIVAVTIGRLRSRVTHEFQVVPSPATVK
jgi:hypothetical protein